MDFYDKKILEHEVAQPIGKAVSQWLRKNNIAQPVCVTAHVMRPSCYIDEQGIAHSGTLITVDCEIMDDDDFDDGDDE